MPLCLGHDDPYEDVDPGVEGEPLDDGADDGTTQLGDDLRLDSPD